MAKKAAPMTISGIVPRQAFNPPAPKGTPGLGASRYALKTDRSDSLPKVKRGGSKRGC